MVEEVFGFDIRFNFNDSKKYDRPSKFRKDFLLNPKIEWLLSVDRHLWPSYFLSKKTIEIRGTIEYEKYIEFEPVNFRHHSLDLWQEEKEMNDCFKRSITDREGVFIAVALIIEKPLLEYDYWNNIFAPFQHSSLKVPKDFSFVGYDIADQGFVSGLSNCVYTKNEIQELAPKWKGLLNQFGLFDNIEHAFEFKEVTERRAQEYAPFFVFSLYTKLDLLNGFQSGSIR